MPGAIVSRNILNDAAIAADEKVAGDLQPTQVGERGVSIIVDPAGEQVGHVRPAELPAGSEMLWTTSSVISSGTGPGRAS
jgi:hypothetical protein